MSIPQQMQAVVVKGKGAAAVETVPVPQPGPGQILVKVHANALNPTDWKHLDFFGIEGSTLGSDFVGTVIAKGPDAGKLVSEGDRVAGCVHGGWEKGTGAFAEYLVTYPAAVVSVPTKFKDEEAAGLGVAGFTSLFGLFQPKHLGLPMPSSATELPPVDDKRKVLVWSGATSVGQFVIQAARASGAYVIATASPNNHEYIKSLGAAETYSYADANVSEKIAQAHPDLVNAFDTFSEKGSTEACARAMSKTQDGKIVTILPSDPNSVAAANSRVKASFLLLYTVSGEETNMYGLKFSREYCQEDLAFMGKMGSADLGLFHALLSKNHVKPNRLSVQQGGFEGEIKGLDKLRLGQVSGEKLIFPL